MSHTTDQAPRITDGHEVPVRAVPVTARQATPPAGNGTTPRFWAGVDWSEGLNDVAVVDRSGKVVVRTRIAESPDGVKQLLRLLTGLGTNHRHSRKHVPVAIESSSGLLTQALRSADQPVVALNPTVVARYRARLHPTKQKSDKGDSALLANILRTDGHYHRALPRHSDQANAITVLARAQLRVQRARQYHHNLLRSLLRDVHPAALQAWADLPGGLRRAEARAVLALGPTPAQAARLTRRQLRQTLAEAGRTRLLDEHSSRLHTLFHDKTLRQRPMVEEAMGTQITASLAMLNQACTTLDDLTGTLEAAFLNHSQAPIYMSFPAVGPLTGARLLAELGDDPDWFADARGLRVYAGAAPLTWASGTSRIVTHRMIANRRLKGIGHMWAFGTLTRSPGCRAHYDRRRSGGEANNAALRNLFGRLLNCLHYCLRHHREWDEERAFASTGKQSDPLG